MIWKLVLRDKGSAMKELGWKWKGRTPLPALRLGRPGLSPLSTLRSGFAAAGVAVREEENVTAGNKGAAAKMMRQPACG